MEIEIISIDNYAGTAVRGWQLSRDPSAAVQNEELFEIDAPVNELPTALLHLSGFTILEREIFVTPRNHVIWARTSRVDDPLEFAIPKEFERKVDQNFHDHCRALMREMKAQGLPQDVWRMQLPLSAQTAWTTRLSYRGIIKLVKLFQSLSLELPLFANRFQAIAIELMVVLDCFTRDKAATERAVMAMKEEEIFNKKPINPRQSLATNGFRILNVKVPLALRAQLVRHRGLHFIDDFHQLLQQPDVLDRTISQELTMELCATHALWHSLISKRSCWIADDRIWHPIIRQFPSGILPCADNKCPYDKDARLRLTDADPGSPCPRHCNLNGIDKGPHLAQIQPEAERRGGMWLVELNR